MQRGHDFFERTRREWLKRALLGGAAMPLLLREALAAGTRARGMPEARETVSTTHHDAPRYIYARGAMPIKMIEPAPVINHTDAELIMLEALVGRKPPFVGSGLKYRNY